MSEAVMVALAREVSVDVAAQRRYEALSDEELTELGLDGAEIAAIRDGFFDRVIRLGLILDDGLPQAHGCCFGT
jgi:hypothetical protein